MGALHAHLAGLDAADAPGSVAQQKNVATHALDGEVLVYRSHEGVLGLGEDVVVGVVGDGASAGQGGEPGPAAPSEPAIDGVAVEVGGAAADAGCDALGKGVQHLVVALAGEISVGVGPAQQVVQRVLFPLSGCALGDDLLRQHVQGPRWESQPVQVPCVDAPHQRHRLQ